MQLRCNFEFVGSRHTLTRRAIVGWRRKDLLAIFSTGRNAHAAVNGEMQLVIRNSTQFMSAEDLAAMSAFLLGLNGSGAAPERSGDRTGTVALIASADPDMPLGHGSTPTTATPAISPTGTAPTRSFPNSMAMRWSRRKARRV